MKVLNFSKRSRSHMELQFTLMVCVWCEVLVCQLCRNPMFAFKRVDVYSPSVPLNDSFMLPIPPLLMPEVFECNSSSAPEKVLKSLPGKPAFFKVVTPELVLGTIPLSSLKKSFYISVTIFRQLAIVRFDFASSFLSFTIC